MSTFVLGYVAATGTALFAIAPDTLPANVSGDPVISLGSVEHSVDADDLPGHSSAVSHVIYHHVREALYHRSHADPADPATHPAGIYDMQRVKILAYGDIAKATGLKSSSLTVEEEATGQLVVKYLPEGTVADLADFDLVSADTDVATINAAGLITGVLAGTTQVTATLKDLRFSVTVTVVVVEAAEE